MDYAIVLGSIFTVHVLAMISPGPNVLIIIQTALSHTRRAGIVAALGIAVGSTIWSSVALLSLSAAFAQFAWLYGGLKPLGGTYLLYLGSKLWRTALSLTRLVGMSRSPASSQPHVSSRSTEASSVG